jgi:hypothetical protein
MSTIGRTISSLFVFSFLAAALTHSAFAQKPEQKAAVDSDQDGLSDALEQSLLLQFAPTFMLDRRDCSVLPAEFAPDSAVPTVRADDGVIYGQVFPARSSTGNQLAAEIHYYHLWRADCGPHGHPLDAEHVSVLVTGSTTVPASANWKALYWYAAAHENTVCDVSQITRASTLHAELTGARVFVSPGKHASYFNEALCRSGCGADKCVNMVAYPSAKIINLGEPGHPMNGCVFVASSQWPLIEKMANSNFPPEPVARLNQMPDTEIAWFNPGRHPAHGIIANSNTTKQALATGADRTTSSLATAGKSADAALSAAQDGTGKVLQKTVKKTGHAIATSAEHVGKALNPQPKSEKPK